jgi:Zn-finger nucleic acid-binding protein
MQQTIFDGVLVDYCPECQAFWLDADEFQIALNSEGEDVRDLWLRAKKEFKDAEKFVVPKDDCCPRCIVGHMETIVKSEIDVDQCERCKGLFFDRGELDKCMKQARHSWLVRIFAHVKDLW